MGLSDSASIFRNRFRLAEAVTTKPMTEEKARETLGKIGTNPNQHKFERGFLAGRDSMRTEIQRLKEIVAYAGLEESNGEWKAQFFNANGTRILLSIDEWKSLRLAAAKEISALRSSRDRMVEAVKYVCDRFYMAGVGNSLPQGTISKHCYDVLKESLSTEATKEMP